MIYTVRLLHFCADLRGGALPNEQLTYLLTIGFVKEWWWWNWGGAGVEWGWWAGPYWALLGAGGSGWERVGWNAHLTSPPAVKCLRNVHLTGRLAVKYPKKCVFNRPAGG